MKGSKGLWIAISIAVFLVFSYIAGGASLLLFAALLAGLMLFLASNSRLARAFMFSVIGFTAGSFIAIAIGYLTNPSGIKSALLFAFPAGGVVLALWYGRKSDFTRWPLLGYRYRL
ncbi:MAG: hypothetical protein GXO14_06425 [Thermococci archaeon]|nr:hypothetical protein [Thermococci archaeon]